MSEKPNRYAVLPLSAASLRVEASRSNGKIVAARMYGELESIMRVPVITRNN